MLLDRVRNNSIPLLAGAVGLLLVVLAGPRLYVSALRIDANLLVFELEQGHRPSLDRVMSARAKLDTAAQLGSDSGTTYALLSHLGLSAALQMAETPARRSLLQQTYLEVEEALRYRPADAYLWTRFAHVSYLLDGLSPTTVAALDKSFFFGARETELVKFRVSLCFLEWPRIPTVLRGQALEQIRLGASYTVMWGQILSKLGPGPSKTLLGELESAGVDVTTVTRIAADLRALRS